MPKPASDRPPSASAPIHRGRARATVSGRRPIPLATWGVLLAAGGLVVWALVPRRDEPVPSVWTTAATSAGATSQMNSDVRMPGHDGSSLLRLDWPEHPNATEYRIRFRLDGGRPGPRPLTVPSAVFLYDLESDVFRLPERFEWSVAAVLSDGTEVLSPWRRHPEP